MNKYLIIALLFLFVGCSSSDTYTFLKKGSVDEVIHFNGKLRKKTRIKFSDGDSITIDRHVSITNDYIFIYVEHSTSLMIKDFKIISAVDWGDL